MGSITELPDMKSQVELCYPVHWNTYKQPVNDEGKGGIWKTLVMEAEGDLEHTERLKYTKTHGTAGSVSHACGQP